MKISKQKIELICDSLQIDTKNIANNITDSYEKYRQELLNNLSSSVLGYGLPHCSGGVCIDPRN